MYNNNKEFSGLKIIYREEYAKDLIIVLNSEIAFLKNVAYSNKNMQDRLLKMMLLKDIIAYLGEDVEKQAEELGILYSTFFQNKIYENKETENKNNNKIIKYKFLKKRNIMDFFEQNNIYVKLFNINIILKTYKNLGFEFEVLDFKNFQDISENLSDKHIYIMRNKKLYVLVNTNGVIQPLMDHENIIGDFIIITKEETREKIRLCGEEI